MYGRKKKIKEKKENGSDDVKEKEKTEGIERYISQKPGKMAARIGIG